MSKRVKYTKLELMDKVPVRKAIVTLAIPGILSQCLTLMYSMVSAYCLGKMGDSAQMAAVTLAMPVTMGIQAIGNIFATGTSPYLSRKLGAKEFDAAKHASSVSFYTAFMISVFTTILFFIFKEPLLQIIGTNEETIGPTRTYVTILTAFSFTNVLMVALSGTVRSEGGTKESMIGMGGGGVVNCILTPLFIFTFDWGIAGAAWAAVGAHVFTLVYFLSIFVRKKSNLSISPKDFKPSWEIYKSILKFGVPMATNTILTSIGGILCNRVANAEFGTATVAAYGICHRMYQIAYMLNFGFCLGYQPFAAYNYGAKNYDRMLKALRISLIYSTCIGTFIALLFLIIPDPLMRIFSSDPNVIPVGVKLLRALMFSAPFLGCQNAFMYTLQGLDMPSRSVIISIGRYGVFIPLLYIFTNIFGFDGFRFSQPVADLFIAAVAAAITIPLILKIKRGTWVRKEDRVKKVRA